MEYITRSFENTRAGLAQKDVTTRELASQGFRIISEHIEQGHIKGEEQCCGALICLPLIFLAGRTPGIIIVTYGREVTPTISAQGLFCASCGAQVSPGTVFCQGCGVETRGNTTSDQRAALLVTDNRQIAKQKTAQAQNSIHELSNVLLEAIEIDHKVDWKATARQYDIPKPSVPIIRPLPKKPDLADFEYQSSFLVRLIPSIRKKRSDSARRRFLQAETAWNKEKARIEEAAARNNNTYQQALSKWQTDKKAFDEAEAASSESKQKLYFDKDPTALKQYWETVIFKFKLPAGLTLNYDFTYLEDRRTLVVDCGLPSFDSIPEVQEVRYDEKKKVFEQILYPRHRQDDFYEQLIYQSLLKTLHELFQSDSANALEVIEFNGFVRAIDRAIGHEVKAYIISARAKKQEFLSINLAQVEPKACVRRLEGSASERMSELVAIEPLTSR